MITTTTTTTIRIFHRLNFIEYVKRKYKKVENCVGEGRDFIKNFISSQHLAFSRECESGKIGIKCDNNLRTLDDT